MKWNVILAHELGIADVAGAFVGAPPTFPITVLQAIGFSPFTSTGDIFNGGVEPNVKDFAFHARPFGVAVFDGDAPIQITCNATIAQTITIM